MVGNLQEVFIVFHMMFKPLKICYGVQLYLGNGDLQAIVYSQPFHLLQTNCLQQFIILQRYMARLVNV